MKTVSYQQSANNRERQHTRLNTYPFSTMYCFFFSFTYNFYIPTNAVM